MQISKDYIVVEKLEQEKQEGFKTVEVQDNFVYKGKVTFLPDVPLFMGNYDIKLGDTVMFTKYSPDTHEVTEEGKTVKFIKICDILAVL